MPPRVAKPCTAGSPAPIFAKVCAYFVRSKCFALQMPTCMSKIQSRGGTVCKQQEPSAQVTHIFVGDGLSIKGVPSTLWKHLNATNVVILRAGWITKSLANKRLEPLEGFCLVLPTPVASCIEPSPATKTPPQPAPRLRTAQIDLNGAIVLALEGETAQIAPNVSGFRSVVLEQVRASVFSPLIT
ncbi:hypothetical protein CYMTET_32338 [Cymbomonas tetramitiformis]|uniref:BRCT domain-containing protein n=1 Tax=Cymbomonas tetramitiformis TaxID=36881 RepID=A0AAE0FF87_9CHLO|nr:hypothetical protein CYMTET_32338 [Cymbomonas tetramitiformis]